MPLRRVHCRSEGPVRTSRAIYGGDISMDSTLIRAAVLASVTWCAGASTLTSFSQASQNWFGQVNQPHCTQVQVGGGALTSTDCGVQVASGSLGMFGNFTTTYSSSSGAFAGPFALGSFSSIAQSGDHDRDAAE